MANFTDPKTGATYTDEKCICLEKVQSDTTTFEIPNTVEIIDDRAFSHCKNLTKVIIPNSVVKIGQLAFYACDTLSEITIPGSVKIIEHSAFHYCKSLTKVVIEDGVEIIRGQVDYSNASPDYGAFYACSALREITIPGSVKTLKKGILPHCESLKKIIIEDGVEKISGGGYYYGSKQMFDAFLCRCDILNEITIPGSVKIIEPYTFQYCKTLKKVIFKDGVETISENAFFGSNLIEEIVIPDSVTKITGPIFSRLYKLKVSGIKLSKHFFIEKGILYETATKQPVDIIPSEIIKQGGVEFSDTLTTIKNLHFADLPISEIQIPDSVTEIGELKFSECHALTKLSGFDSVRKIHKLTFNNCNNLATIEIPNSVIEIGNLNFSNCSTLTKIGISNTKRINNLTFNNCNDLVSVEIPSVNEIGELLFTNCIALTKLEIPISVKKITKFTFDNCNALTSFGIAENSAIEIAGLDFDNCLSISKVAIPNTVNKIKELKLSDCLSLKTVEIADNATILNLIIARCDSLDTIVIPSKMETKRVKINKCKSLTDTRFVKK